MDLEQAAVDMSKRSLSPRDRKALFVVLVVAGLAYIGAFVWFKRHSVDFIARELDMNAAVAAAVIRSPTIVWTFEKGSHALAMLGGGWQLPDAEAIWSEPRGGVVYLPASMAAGSELEIHFDGQLNSSDQEMGVHLIANGTTVGQWRLTQQHWQIVDQVTLPPRANDAMPWRLLFAIERPARPLWRGYEPGLLAYGIHFRGLRTSDAAERQQPAD